jgi:cytoskeletal protein CcmA (bactofilin family)
MYIHNESVVNFALGNNIEMVAMPNDDESGIEGSYETKNYGLLTLLVATSITQTDTMMSVGFAGCYSRSQTALYLASAYKFLSYSGTVNITGQKQLPSQFIEAAYINNTPNRLVQNGATSLSGPALPPVNPAYKRIFEGMHGEKTKMSEVDKPKDSIYFNSFLNPAKEIIISSVLAGMTIKGNFIIRASDSIQVKKSAMLEDVILMAPKITFEDGFQGTVQAFATTGIDVGKDVVLAYPSALCVLNEKPDGGKIRIGSECRITGTVVMLGNEMEANNRNTISISKGGLITGDIYCSGRLMLQSNVYGAVYTSRFYYDTGSTTYDNLIANVEINLEKRPEFFIGLPLFATENSSYGILKKVL